jgi:hypothetical protein
VRPEGLGKFKNSPHRVSKPRHLFLLSRLEPGILACDAVLTDSLLHSGFSYNSEIDM